MTIEYQCIAEDGQPVFDEPMDNYLNHALHKTDWKRIFSFIGLDLDIYYLQLINYLSPCQVKLVHYTINLLIDDNETVRKYRFKEDELRFIQQYLEQIIEKNGTIIVFGTVH